MELDLSKIPVGKKVVYHIGNLSVDRTKDAELHKTCLELLCRSFGCAPFPYGYNAQQKSVSKEPAQPFRGSGEFVLSQERTEECRKDGLQVYKYYALRVAPSSAKAQETWKKLLKSVTKDEGRAERETKKALFLRRASKKVVTFTKN